MREAVIVSTARTPIGKAYRGAFNNTTSPTLGGHVIRAVVERAGVDPGEVDDVVMGAAQQQGTSGNNVARHAALRAVSPRVSGGPTLLRTHVVSTLSRAISTPIALVKSVMVAWLLRRLWPWSS